MLRLSFLLAARGIPPVRRLAAGANGAPARVLQLATRQFAGVAPEDDAATRKKQEHYYSRIKLKLETHGYWQAVKNVDLTVVSFMALLGVDKTKALHAISRCPTVVYISPEDISRKIAWLRQIGSTETDIRTAITRGPIVLTVRIETMEAIRDWYIGQGVAPDKIPYIFARFPQVAARSITNNLEPKVEVFKSFGLSEKQIASILSRAPHIFGTSVKSLESNVGFLLKHCISQADLPKVLFGAPECLCLTTENIMAKVSLLEEMFGPETARRVLSSNSRMFMYNLEGLRRSFDFLLDLGIPREQLGNNFSLVMRNTDRILKPRAEFLASAGLLEPTMRTVTWIKDSHSAFIKRFPAYEEYAQQHDDH